MARWGFFITVEGVEGSGKSTLARGLAERLQDLGLSVILTREPGGTEVAEAIREVVLKKNFDMEPWTEVFLLFAARYENVKRVVLPALQEGKIVISDRFSDSTFAYQGYGRGLPLKLLARLNKLASLGLKPNLTFLLDLPVEEGLGRKTELTMNRFEKEQFEFHKRIREGYLKLAHRAKKRIKVLDARKRPDELIEESYRITLLRLKEKGKIKGQIELKNQGH